MGIWYHLVSQSRSILTLLSDTCFLDRLFLVSRLRSCSTGIQPASLGRRHLIMLSFICQRMMWLHSHPKKLRNIGHFLFLLMSRCQCPCKYPLSKSAATTQNQTSF